ncbi:HflK protein, partial [candidate division KSB1 bacterium]|nr:HflK protein [candidate division KSB1 bacterium]
IDNVILQDVQPPNQVAEAFRDVASAIQDRSRRINEAEGYRNNIIPQARGEAEQLVREAEAYMEQRVRRAEGDAARFISVYEEYSKARDVTRTRMYLETMLEILPSMDIYIIQSEQSGGIINLLNLNKGGGQ